MTAGSTAVKHKRTQIRSRNLPILWEKYGIYGVLLFVFIIGVLFVEHFSEPRNITNVLIQSVALGIVATGQTFVVLIGGIDLSVAAVMSASNVLAAGIMLGRENMILPAVLICLCFGTLVGLGSGWIITATHVPAIIATLGMMRIVQDQLMCTLLPRLAPHQIFSFNLQTDRWPYSYCAHFVFCGSGCGRDYYPQDKIRTLSVCNRRRQRSCAPIRHTGKLGYYGGICCQRFARSSVRSVSYRPIGLRTAILS